MDADFFYYITIFVFSIFTVDAVPPEACFATFRWDDCGQPPKQVLYYWKPGSRCEVGIWRGCLPNINMFHDEYECINTCIFVARAQPEDYHNHLQSEYPEETTIEMADYGNLTDVNVTQSLNETVTEAAGNSTIEEGVTGDGGNDTQADAGATGEEGTAAPAGEETAAPAE
ncbi:unnamed protein product [Diatraea saccharalis]|uniref:BPTI/Kunitz inhibitor domain-containing protein n=1 Tax=Diatraea saccharalis TaxID=40085 RepID=A0A9N9QVL6_9NEOP|nr:unnamed protein product [Diatraea saccharalis]